MPYASARDKGKARAIQPQQRPEESATSLSSHAAGSRVHPYPHPHPPLPPQQPHTTMPLSPPKTSPSPPGLPPFPGEEPNDVFSQAGPSRRPMEHAPAIRGPPIDVDAVETSSTPVEVDLVVQCKACRTIVGDSSAYVAARKDLGLLVLSSVAQHVVLSNPPSTAQDPDLNSLYMPLEITCGSCGSPLGKVYRMTAAGLDELRDGYSFERDRISVYQLGTGVRSSMLAPLHPDRQANQRDQDWRRGPTGPNGSSEDVYSPQQQHQNRSPPPLAHLPPHERMMGGVPPTPGQGHLPYHQQATPGGPGPYSMYNRPPSLAPMRRTPSIAAPMSLRGSVGPMSMRGSMTPGPGGGAGATVASLKQKAIMIEMGDRIKSLEGGIGSMDERVRNMLDERMGPVEGLLREIIRGQANLAGGVGSGSGSGSGSSAERTEDRRQPPLASTTTTTPQRPPPAGLNGSASEGTSANRSTAVTPTASNGGMPPPSSVPRSAGSSNRIPKSMLSSLSGTPLRKRIVDQRKAAGQSPGSVATERIQSAQTQTQVQANAAFKSPAAVASPRSNTQLQPTALAGSPQKSALATSGAVLHHRAGSPSLAALGPIPGQGQEAGKVAPPTAQYEHDELDGLDNSFDGLDGDVQEADAAGATAEGGLNEGERNGALHRAGGTGAARGRKRKAV